MEYRHVVQLSLGSKVTMLIAGVLLVAAGYTYWVPLSVPNSSGGPFACQSAAHPPTDPLPKSICGEINTAYRYRAVALLVAAVVTGGGGLLLFGATRRRETRPVSRPAI